MNNIEEAFKIIEEELIDDIRKIMRKILLLMKRLINN
jgi:hypothetical protein